MTAKKLPGFHSFTLLLLIACGCGGASYRPLSGTLIAPDGHPIADVMIQASQVTKAGENQGVFRAKSGQDGKYTFDQKLRPGMYRISVSDKDYLSGADNQGAPSQELNFFGNDQDKPFNWTLWQKLSLTGVVYDTGGTSSVSGAAVTLTPRAVPNFLKDKSQTRADTDKDGRFSFEPVYTGVIYDIAAYTSSKASTEKGIEFKTAAPARIKLVLQAMGSPSVNYGLKVIILGGTVVLHNPP
jgi:hypothetical protein